MLFWFGVIIQGVVLFFVLSEYAELGYSTYLLDDEETNPFSI